MSANCDDNLTNSMQKIEIRVRFRLRRRKSLHSRHWPPTSVSGNTHTKTRKLKLSEIKYSRVKNWDTYFHGTLESQRFAKTGSFSSVNRAHTEERRKALLQCVLILKDEHVLRVSNFFSFVTPLFLLVHAALSCCYCFLLIRNKSHLSCQLSSRVADATWARYRHIWFLSTMMWCVHGIRSNMRDPQQSA